MLKLREVLINLGARPVILDQGIFCWFNNPRLIGLMVIFVDDILYGGDQTFTSVTNQLKVTFKVGAENETKLAYIGLNIVQNPNFSITISQKDYVENLEPISLSTININKLLRPLVEVEKTILRGRPT